MTTRYDLEILIRTKKEGTGIADADKQVGNFGKTLNGMLGTLSATAAAAAGAGVVFKKTFDFAKEGAGINQLEDSFDLLNTQVLQTPGLLDALTEASRNTIKETDLMAGVLTLTAGQTDEMARQFAAAAPRLLEYAKASNKLNPALGDTAFLYNSITTGIKRSSPLILDNLGIVVKVGEANKTYAEELGKTVEQLTAQEKQIALLNATMEAGEKLVDQVGGDIDSQQDSWLALEASVDTVTDSFKTFLADGLTPWVKLVNGDYSDAIEKIEMDNIAAAEATDDYTLAKHRSIEAERLIIASAAKTSSSVEEFSEKLYDAGILTVENDSYTQQLTRSWYEQEKAAIATAAATDELNEKMERTATLNAMSAENAMAAAIANVDYSDTLAMIANVSDTTEGRAVQFNSSLDEQGTRFERAAERAELLRKEIEALEQAQQAEFVDTFTNALTVSDSTMLQWTTDATVMNQTLFDQIAATADNEIAIASAGIALGLYDESQIGAALNAAIMNEKINALAESFVNGSITAGELRTQMDEIVAGSPYTSEFELLADGAKSELKTIKSDLDGLDGRVVRSKVIVETERTGGGASGGSTGTTERDAGMASGGSFTVPTRFNERAGRPFMLALDGGEQVNVATSSGNNSLPGGLVVEKMEINVMGGNTSRQTAQRIATATIDELGKL